MKTKKDKNERSTVQQPGKIRENMGSEIKDMPYEQLKKYIEEKLTLHPESVWRNEDKVIDQ